jgi:hypothetical protein
LLDANPPTPRDYSDSDRDLVVILETNDRVQLALAKGLLDDAGIPYFVMGQIATLIQDIDGFLKKWVRLQVPRSCESEARELMAQLQFPITDDFVEPEA